MTLYSMLLSLVSGLIGALFSSLLYLRYEGRKIKREAACRLIANCHDIRGDEFTRALNEVYVVFSDDKKVVVALKSFHDVIVSKQQALATPRLIALFKAVMRASGIDPSKMGDSFFETPFNIKIPNQQE